MEIPVPDLGNDDVKRICEIAQSALRMTDTVCAGTSLVDVHVHQTALEKSENGLELVINVLDREISKLKNSLDAVESMKRDIARHGKRATRAYWLLKNAQPK